MKAVVLKDGDAIPDTSEIMSKTPVSCKVAAAFGIATPKINIWSVVLHTPIKIRASDLPKVAAVSKDLLLSSSEADNFFLGECP